MRIAVVGAGYVGLVTGTCLAEAGHLVRFVDADAERVARLQAGQMPLYEPGLEELVRRNAREGRLAFTGAFPEAVEDADVVFIAVGTPRSENGAADLSFVLSAAREVGAHLSRYAVVAIKSTVPPGSAERVAALLAEVAHAPFDVVSNPEFLEEGAAVDTFTRPDRVVVGVASERARAVMAELYAPFVRAGQPLLFMDRRSAEATKYAANAMLATRVSFMNEMAALCERLGADVDQVRRGIGSDRRIGQRFLFPGVGFGGSCLPKDVAALVAMARGFGLDFDLLRAVERVNERQVRLLVEKALRHFRGALQGRTFGVWGLAFKPKTDDLRAGPAVAIVKGLLGHGGRVRAHDPVAIDAARRVFGDTVELVDEPYAAADGADALLLVTEWSEFRQPDFERLRRTMRGDALLDGRNVWDAAKARAAGFTYYGVGRAAEKA